MSHEQAKRIILPLNVLSVAASLLLMFNLMPKLTGAVCVLCVLVSWVLVFRFPDRFSLHPSKELKKQGLDGQYCSVEFSLIFSVMFPTLHMLRSHTPANWWHPIIAAVILTVLLLILAFRFLSGHDLGRGDLIGYVILFGLFHIGCIWQVNLLLDLSAPEYEQVVVQTVDESHSRRGGTTYYVEGELDGEEQRINVTRAQWRQLEVGDTVTVAIHAGGLGMEYYTLEEP